MTGAHSYFSTKRVNFKRSDFFHIGIFFSYLAALSIDSRLVFFPMFFQTIKIVIRLGPQLRKMNPFQRRINLFIAPLLMAFPEAIPAHAIEFSLLLDKTEKMMQTCIFDQVTGMKVLSGLIFAGVRGVYMFGLVGEAQEWRDKQKHNQNASESIKGVVGMIIGVIVLGVLEPFFSKSCSS
jgi:hypothetical protein